MLLNHVCFLHSFDILPGFTIPPNYSAKQIYESFKAPAWTWDFLSNDPYKYACINTEVPADSLAAFVNSQINPSFTWDDAVCYLTFCNEAVTIKCQN